MLPALHREQPNSRCVLLDPNSHPYLRRGRESRFKLLGREFSVRSPCAYRRRCVAGRASRAPTPASGDPEETPKPTPASAPPAPDTGQAGWREKMMQLGENTV